MRAGILKTAALLYPIILLTTFLSYLFHLHLFDTQAIHAFYILLSVYSLWCTQLYPATSHASYSLRAPHNACVIGDPAEFKGEGLL
jgi:hypothetical protein